MRLETLEVADFRKFDRPVRLDGFGPGLNLLCEPNEFGKSTLLAAIKAVLFERHRARNANVERMRHHRNQTSPVVRLGFTLSGGLHHIEKRFLHRESYARLTLPDGSRLESDTAEERLQALLGFAPAGKQGAKDETIGLWGALWCDQQTAAQQPELQALGRSTLHGCLEQELGTLAGNDRAGAVRATVDAELARLLDGRGAPKGRYKEVVALKDVAASELAALRRHRAELAEAIADLARLRRELAQADAPGAEALLAADMQAARRRRDEVLHHQATLRQAVTDLRLAEQGKEAAAAERQRRQGRELALRSARDAVAAAEAADKDATGVLADVEATLASLRTAVQTAEDASAGAGRAARGAAATSALARRAAELERLQLQRDAAVALQAEVNRLSGALAAQPADEARLHAVRTAERDRERAAAALDAQATEIVLDLLPDGSGVHANGAPVPPGHTTLRVTADTLLHIPGIGDVRIRPAIANRAALQDKEIAAEAALRTALQVLGVADLAQAEQLATTRRTAADALRAAEARLEAATPGDAGLGLAPGLEALRNHVAMGESRLAAELATAGIDGAGSLPNPEAADKAVREAGAAEAAAAEVLARAREALAGPHAALGRLTADRTATAGALTEARSTLARLEREDAVARVEETDEALSARLAATGTALDAQRATVDQLNRSAPPETAEQMDARITRLEAAIRQREATVRELRETIATRAAHITRDEGDGLDEQIAAADRRRADLDAEHTASQREAAVLSLLRDTLADAEREARERYRAPVMRRIASLLHCLFPGVSVSLDDDLRVTGVTRRDEAEHLDRLSDGTREQLAVLLRLAYADLLLERGRPATVILDDALAYSDPERRELMFDVLAQAAERMQILILTCRTDAFSRLGGNRVRLVPA